MPNPTYIDIERLESNLKKTKDKELESAIHDNVAGEILTVTEKGSPHNDDLVIIEDSEASYAKKRVTLSKLPGGGGGGGDSYLEWAGI